MKSWAPSPCLLKLRHNERGEMVVVWFGCSQHIYENYQEEAPRGLEPSGLPYGEPHKSGNISQIFPTGGQDLDLPRNRPA